MKKTFAFLLALLIAGSAFAQKAPTTKLISSSEEQIVVNVQLNGFTATPVKTPQGEQVIITAPGMVSALEAGAPDLPMFAIPAIIGDRAEMTINIIDAQYTDLNDMDIAPSKGNFSRQINPDDVPYTYGTMYQQDAFYPATQAYLEAPYILRDFRGQNIMVRPFAYNAQTRTLRVYDNLTIEMKKVSDNGENQKLSRKSNTITVDPEMKQAYSHRFINFGAGSAKYTFVEDRGTMLVICPDQYMDAMQPFVNWKNQSGRPTTMVSLSEAGGNNDNQIKAYIQNVYQNENLEFILLVGDYADITPHSMNNGRSDNWFGMLEGGASDYYVEAFTGRFSVQNVADVETHVNKVIHYERDMDETDTWANQGIGIGANEGAGSGHMGGEADYVHMNYIRDTLLHYTYTTVTQQYSGVGGGTSASAISNDVNNGATIINYCNHGSQTSWAVANYSNSNVNALVNDNKLPIVWSVACNNGEFNGTCFGEAWLRATNNNTGAPTGAIGGMFSWISQPWTPPMTGQDEMVDILTEWIGADQFNHTLGGASLNGNMKILDAHPSDGGNTHNTWILFGDPSLMVRTDVPASMNVSCNPSVLFIGMNTLEVSAENTPFGLATLSNAEGVLASAYLVDGVAALEFPALAAVETLTLTVMGYNKATEVIDFEVLPAEGAFLCVTGYEPNFAFVSQATEMSMSLKNVGADPTTGNTNITLSCDDERITFPNGSAEFGVIAANQEISLENAFSFLIADGVADGTKFTIEVSMVCGREEWSGKAVITAGAPLFELVSITNTELTPGAEGTIEFAIANNGGANAAEGVFEVYASSSELSLESNTFILTDLNAGETFTLPVNLTVDANVELGATYEVNYLLTAGHYALEGSYIVTVGNIVEGFETGDFSMYNWTFGGAGNWTIQQGNANSGDYCAKSGSISHSSQSELILTTEILADGEVSFYKKVSSESNWDKLFFYIDNAEMGNWSGEVAWSQETFPVTTGTHTFKWSYSKDGSVSSGSDCAWVDDIQFPPTSVTLALDPISNLNAEVVDNTVTLTWDELTSATDYTIRRNGEEIATIALTTFTETVENGVYVYSVIAKDDEGHCSAPAYLTVEVNLDAVEEHNVAFNIYPNPVSNTLYVNCGNTEFSYVLYNCMGQMVVNGTAQGSKEINVNGMMPGVYFLHLTNGSQTMVQKVVVK